jgi:hypothetical protein
MLKHSEGNSSGGDRLKDNPTLFHQKGQVLLATKTPLKEARLSFVRMIRLSCLDLSASVPRRAAYKWFTGHVRS